MKFFKLNKKLLQYIYMSVMLYTTPNGEINKMKISVQFDSTEYVIAVH